MPGMGQAATRLSCGPFPSPQSTTERSGGNNGRRNRTGALPLGSRTGAATAQMVALMLAGKRARKI
jgi:hypothetical protein